MTDLNVPCWRILHARTCTKMYVCTKNHNKECMGMSKVAKNSLVLRIFVIHKVQSASYFFQENYVDWRYHNTHLRLLHALRETTDGYVHTLPVQYSHNGHRTHTQYAQSTILHTWRHSHNRHSMPRTFVQIFLILHKQYTIFKESEAKVAEIHTQYYIATHERHCFVCIGYMEAVMAQGTGFFNLGEVHASRLSYKYVDLTKYLVFNTVNYHSVRQRRSKTMTKGIWSRTALTHNCTDF